MSEKAKPNYFGSTWYNEYQGEFTGYSLFLTAAELEAAKEQLDPKSNRVKIIIKPGRDPKKPYSILENVQEASMRRSNNAAASAPASQANDLPF